MAPFLEADPNVCPWCGQEYQEKPGHTGGDDYYGGLGEECTVMRCGCGR